MVAEGAGLTLRSLPPLLARLLLTAAALLLLYTGLAKVSDTAAFRSTIEAHGFLPAWSLATVAWALPLAEIALGVGGIGAIAFGRGAALACAAIAVLFVAFAAYAGAMIAAPPAEPVGCGCGLRAGPISDWRPLLVQNGGSTAAMAAAGLILLRVRRRPPPAPQGAA